MKQSISGGGGGRRRILPTETEVEIAQALLLLTPSLLTDKSEMPCTVTSDWGRRKRRTEWVPKSESSPATHRKTEEKSTPAMEADKSPTTPICFLASGSGSDGGDMANRLKKSSRKRTREDLMVSFNQLRQEREFLTRQMESMKNQYQQLESENKELKARKQEVKYSRNTEDLESPRNKPMNLDHQRYHQQITMFAPPPPPPPPCPAAHFPQLMVDSGRGQRVGLTSAGNNSSSSGIRLGLMNQIEPRGLIHGEVYDFMAPSQPSDQHLYVIMDNDLRAKAAAAARHMRIIKMKEKQSKR